MLKPTGLARPSARRRAASILAALVVCAAFAAAQDAATTRPAPPRPGETLVFVGSRVPATKDGLRIYAFDPSGPAFRPLAAIRGVASPTYLAYAPELGRFFAVSEVARHGDVDEGEVVAFDFDAATGATKPAWRRRSGGKGPCHLAKVRRPRRDGMQTMVAVAHYGDGRVTVMTADPTPAEAKAPPLLLNDVAAQPIAAGPVKDRQEAPHAHFVAQVGDRDHVIWCDLGADAVCAARLTFPDERLNWTVVGSGSGPRHAVVRSGLVFVLCELSSTIDTYDLTLTASSAADRWRPAPLRRPIYLGPDAQPPETPTLPAGVTKAGNFPAAIKLSPDRRRLFVSNRGADLIATFDVERKSGPQPKASIPTYGPWPAVSFVPSGGAWPWDLDPSPDGRFLFVANYKSDEVVAFAIDPATGAPTTVVARVAVEKPTCVVAAATTDAAASRPASSTR